MIRTVRQDRITEIHTMALLAVAVMWVGVVASRSFCGAERSKRDNKGEGLWWR